MSNNLAKHTLGLTHLQSGQGTPIHQAPLGTFYIDVSTSEYYKNTDGNTNWVTLATGSGGTFTGGTVTGATIFTNGLTANTISATTYYNLPLDINVTGASYSNNTFTFTNNTGGTFDTLFNVLTGVTVNGNVSISGSSLPNGYALSVTGDTNFVGDVYVTGDLTYNGNLLVTGGTVVQSGLTANTIYTDYIDFNTAFTGATLPAGRLQWDNGNGTLVLGLKGGISNIELGLENMALCFNDEATTLTAGTVVYVSGSQGNRPKIKRAIATSDGYSVTTLGVVSESIASGAEGFVTTFGMVNNLNTIGYSGGTPIWLSPTDAGGYTAVKPQGPYHTVLIGYVVRVHASVGSIFVHVSNGWELDEIHDVKINGRMQGDLLSLSAYNGYNVWVNAKTLNGSYTITGDTTVGGVMKATTISATTYQNLPLDIRVTGATYSNNTFTFTNNTGGTFDTLFNVVSGLTINGSLTVTGNTSVKGLTGTSATISGSGQNILTIIGSGNSTSQPIFTVQGSSGELFSVSDSLSGSLFSVNDISGLPIIEVFSDNTVLIGDYLAPSLNTTVKKTLTAGTNTIYSLPTSAYTGAFFEYTVISSGATGARAGSLMSIWSGTTAQYTDVSTNDIGNTSDISFSVSVSSGNAILSSSATTAGWTLKTIVRGI